MRRLVSEATTPSARLQGPLLRPTSVRRGVAPPTASDVGPEEASPLVRVAEAGRPPARTTIPRPALDVETRLQGASPELMGSGGPSQNLLARPLPEDAVIAVIPEPPPEAVHGVGDPRLSHASATRQGVAVDATVRVAR